MALYFWRPKQLNRSNEALIVGTKKRRRPQDSKLSLKICKIFEKPRETADDNSSNLMPLRDQLNSQTSKPIPKDLDQVDSKTPLEIKADLEDGCSSSSTATLTGTNDTLLTEKTITNHDKLVTDDKETKEKKTDNNEDENSTTLIPSSLKEIKNEIIKSESNSEEAGEDIKEQTLVEKMNTSDCENDNNVSAMDITPSGDDETVQAEEATKSSVVQKIPKKGEETRLKKQKTRAKLNTIVQQLIAKQPTNCTSTIGATSLGHLSKTPLPGGGGSGGGAINSSNNTGIHKVFIRFYLLEYCNSVLQ